MRTRINRLGILWIPAALALALATGCGPGNATPDVSRMACEEIVEACHPVDPGTGPIHDCHEFAEDPANTHAACMAREAECFRLCAPADGGVDGATDASRDASADGSPDASTDASTDAPRDATSGG